ncbi:MAG: DUF4132 domain-containing protein [Gammaproteobacteria bacterium]|nr:DUF4132 domain-containing protein [Gammaproteobacteria bacterium]MDH5802569.1 DUF4132 domain-containing protein [Gammaproteobacteria bacterium]
MLNRVLSQSTTTVAPNSELEQLLGDIEAFVRNNNNYFYPHSKIALKDCSAYEQLKNLKGYAKLEALEYLIKTVNTCHIKGSDYGSHSYQQYSILTSVLDTFIRTKFDFPDNYSFHGLFHHLYEATGKSPKHYNLQDRPFGGLVTQIEKHVKSKELNKELQADIEAILENPVVQSYIGKKVDYGIDIARWTTKLQQLLFSRGDSEHQVPPYEPGNGRFGALLKNKLQSLDTQEQDRWNALFNHLASAGAGRPSQKFLKSANSHIDTIGIDKFKQVTNSLLQTATEFEIESVFNDYYSVPEFVESYSNNLIKGLVWSLSRFHDRETLHTIVKLSEKCFKKVPGFGPTATAIGNACLYTLANSIGLEGIAHLTRLKLKIRQNNTRKLIHKYIEEQASKRGIKPAQIEQMAVPEYGLTLGERSDSFDDYQLVLKLSTVGKTEFQWIKPDGSIQKTVPAFVKSKTSLSDKLKKIKDIAKQVKQDSSTQRDRIDRLYVENLSLNMDDFQKYYLHHGLVSQIARKLIWNLDKQAALYVNDEWQNEQGEVIQVPDEAEIRLWHPIDTTAETVLAWRERLEQLQIKQPIKQAYREIYILTDAEINTRVYSNRMAAHLIKQHQFGSLASIRGWKYALMGYFDGGGDSIASKVLSEYKLSAEFWINELTNTSDNYYDNGIWSYVATDQVRFVDEDRNAVPLVDVPPMAFSEIMRDVDLFVGVASVGNDPEWQDGGPQGRQDYRDYWHSYSFGDLSEVAKTRKSVLERLLPRLKIRNVAHIDGKFLIVKGKKNTYKIHIGSGNILIAPNDRYLCIVPGRGKDTKIDQLYLPFEGDTGLSIVLSKAFLLMDDDKIKDPTIVSQL